MQTIVMNQNGSLVRILTFLLKLISNQLSPTAFEAWYSEVFSNAQK